MSPSRSRSRSSRRVEVVLPSGRSCAVQLHSESSIGELAAAARAYFRRGLLRLVGPGGLRLDPGLTLGQAGVGDGSVVHAIAQPVEMAATTTAFALYVRGGSAMTWAVLTWIVARCKSS
ncbi:unnamed protein product [Effrenium voratum]|uniref:Ubiquitin-like domain-containing protein n=1 Tax=Effrenium voratum TaxID=2562239 RepID=A0AA36IK10_9DINO|nr:unnamed protein product [Effrenium voratum]